MLLYGVTGAASVMAMRGPALSLTRTSDQTVETEPFRFAGFTLDAWSFALRTWVAMMAALYAAFWLQLESASSAAVCVGILALPTRGQAYEKALYRAGGTVLGVTASLVIAGLFNGARDLFILAFGLWMALSVFAASLLDGNQAYGAVLSGYTVAIVALGNIDTPQDVFVSGVNRGAAIAIGIAALMLINDIVAAPDTYADVLDRLEAAHRRVRAFARTVLRSGDADPDTVTALVRTITGLRSDISAMPTEAIAGRARAAAARTAVVAMAREVAAARATGVVLRDGGATCRPLVEGLLAALDDAHGAPGDDLARRIAGLLDSHRADAPLFVGASAADIMLEQHRRTLNALDDLRHDRGPPRGPRLPLFRAREAALRNALRVFIAVLAGATFFALTGWPATSFSMVLLGATAGLSATAPSPRQFAAIALIAIPTAFVLAGVTEFLVLDGVDAFPLLALGLAPAVVGAGLLSCTRKPVQVQVGKLLLVFTPVLLGLSNPQTYDPQTYLIQGGLAILAVVALFVVLATVLPTSDARKRRWILRSLQRDFRHALTATRPRLTADETAFRDADRIAQLGALTPAAAGHAPDLRTGLRWAALTSAAWRVRIALADESLPAATRAQARAALAAQSPAALREVAGRLMAERQSQPDDAAKRHRWAATTLAWMAALIEHSADEIEALLGAQRP